MWNNQVPVSTSADVMSQIASYFSIVDNAVQMADTNKRYTISSHSCYGPSPPVPARSFTSLVISPVSDNMADLYNGFINAKLEIPLSIILASDLTTQKINGNSIQQLCFLNCSY